MKRLQTAANIRAVRSFPSIWLLALLPFLSGCDTYTQVLVTNPRGELITAWVARGPVWPVEDGYRITAVQRTDGMRFAKTIRYPDGWRTTVVGPYVRRTRCAKPAWMECEHVK